MTTPIPAPEADEISSYEWMAQEFERLAILGKMWSAHEVAAILRRYDIERTTSPSGASTTPIPAAGDAELIEARDEAVNYVFDRLAKALGLQQWVGHDGSETWDGDVAATLMGILRDSKAIDPDTDVPAADRLAAANAIQEPVAWCQPMENGKHGSRAFLVRFDDRERGDAVFFDEADARRFWEEANVSWNCYLFGTLPLAASPREQVAPEVGELVARGNREVLYHSYGERSDLPEAMAAATCSATTRRRPMAELWDANREIERLQLKLAEAERETERYMNVAVDAARLLVDADARIATLTEALRAATNILEYEGYPEEAKKCRAALQTEDKPK